MKITLWENEIPNYNPELETPNSMTFYKVQTGHPQPAVVIFPGGGYTNRCDTYEGEEVARYYNSKGFHAFVVDYRVLPHMFPCALQDAQRAVKLIKSRAKEYMVDANRIFVLGFSAGGHLAGCVATMEDYAKIGDELDEISPKPTGTILCYPVISADVLYGSNSHIYVERICGEGTTPQSISLEKCVTEETTPCFVWHTCQDKVVSLANSLHFCEALKEKEIPFEYHVYPYGHHGLGLAKTKHDVSEWPDNTVRWMLSF